MDLRDDLVQRVAEMREAQKAWFLKKDRAQLARAKRLESTVDGLLAVILERTRQTDLFAPQKDEAAGTKEVRCSCRMLHDGAGVPRGVYPMPSCPLHSKEAR